MDKRIVLICSAGDQLPVNISSEHRAPEALRTFQDVEADSSQFVDIRVVYLCEESDFGWIHGIIIGEKQLQFENAA